MRSARVTLAVHPLFGQELAVRSAHGPDGVRVETADGKLRLLPLAWTSLRPRGEPLAHEGQLVRLAPEALLELAAWVKARGTRPEPSARDGEKFAPEIDPGDKTADGKGFARGSVSATSVVGQARSHKTGRRGKQQRRGRRSRGQGRKRGKR